MRTDVHPHSSCPGAVPPARSRREFLATTANGFGLVALAALMADRSYAGLAESDGGTHHAPRAKRVIFCFMDGGVSHVDTFDQKPMLATHEGKKIGQEAVSRKAQSSAERVWLGSPWKFRPRGQSGLVVSDLLARIASSADDLCVVRSLVGEQPLHGQQSLLLHTGRVTGRAPSVGSWASYGLGTENRDLPGYVLLNNDWIPNGGFENFDSAFLPATHAATLLRARGSSIDNIVPAGTARTQRRKLDLLRAQDAEFARGVGSRDTVEAAIRNYETAFRMQTAIPRLIDVSRETLATREMYGVESSNEYKRYYSLQCLRARRLVEAGVRFIEITCPLTHANNSPWDQHSRLKERHEENAMITDQAVNALIVDLKQRGLLDETIVLWAGEMGRTPHTPKITPTVGRDHHVNGYSIFLAGGGFRGGTVFGETDEFGNSVVRDPLTIHDIHATVLHQLGIDHTRLTYRFGGLDVRLTNVYGKVIGELLT